MEKIRVHLIHFFFTFALVMKNYVACNAFKLVTIISIQLAFVEFQKVKEMKIKLYSASIAGAEGARLEIVDFNLLIKIVIIFTT